MTDTGESTWRPPAGWSWDPAERHEHRYWDGATWTIRVRDGEVESVDPPPLAAAPYGTTDESGVYTHRPLSKGEVARLTAREFLKKLLP